MTAPAISFDQMVEQVSATLSLPIANLSPDTLLQNLGVDSFRFVEMVVDLQERFDAIFTQTELMKISTLGELHELLSSAR
jgi:acyl carrier protein